ncbi:hypothetical protein DFH08DRAFT_963707 [Mycena albidolilacea]|uniref:Uncharacterized protein n=1 Tax=Mycena albidolilacea TaxID=1033008 RepID=A0AAD6ZV49_9AGAR|nr:hypothetical protein DFH08DRAFT_963707 [Mycena albidolilacea]
MATWDWKVNNVHIPAPNSRTLDPDAPKAWNKLTFDPTSAYDLCRHLGPRIDEPGCLMASLDKFLASDIAWLACGASTNGGHQVPSDGFFKEFDDLCNATVAGNQGAMDRKAFIELARRLLYDLSTMIDCAIGSTTMVMTVEGTTAPGTPQQPECLKAFVLMPPSFVCENPGSHAHIATIIQMFIEHVGVPTVASWTRRARARWGRFCTRPTMFFTVGLQGWTSLNPIVPAPVPAPVPPAPTPFVPSQDVYDIDEIPMDGITLDLVTAYEHIADLEHNLANSDHQVDILQTCVGDYERMQADAARELMAVEAELACLREENLQLRADHALSPPSTPAGLRAALLHSTPSRGAPSTPSRLTARIPSTPPPYAPSVSTPTTPRGAQASTRTTGPLKWAMEIDSLECFPDHLKGELVLALERDVSI